MMKVGIFSGTFDPIHNGHMALALQAINECNLDKVFFLPEPEPRRKQAVRPLSHRLAMLEAALEGHDGLGVIALDQPQFTTAATFGYLRRRFKGAELHLLFGEDVAMRMLDWPDVERMLAAVKIVVGVRTSEEKLLHAKLNTLQKTKGVSFNYNIVNTPLSSESSQNIRALLRKGRGTPHVPPGVLTYIRTHHLYSIKAT